MSKILRPYFKHHVIEFWSVEPDLLHNFTLIDISIKEAVNEMEINVLESISHEFTPQGLTILYLLSASHLAVHTWPEYKYTHIDVMTCSISDVNLLAKKMKSALNPGEIKISEVQYL